MDLLEKELAACLTGVKKKNPGVLNIILRRSSENAPVLAGPSASKEDTIQFPWNRKLLKFLLYCHTFRKAMLLAYCETTGSEETSSVFLKAYWTEVWLLKIRMSKKSERERKTKSKRGSAQYG